jgi:hypothetical protein
MRPGEISDIAISLYASMPENHWAYAYYTDVPLAAPLLTPITVTSTTQTPIFVTVTAMSTDADRHSSATPSPEVDDEKVRLTMIEDGGGLPSGAKAGIGVGVSAGVLLVAAGGFWFFRRGRRRMEDGACDSVPVIRGPDSEFPSGIISERPRSELEGNSTVLPSITTTVVERGPPVRYEMDG